MPAALEIGTQLVTQVNQGASLEFIDKYYADDIASLEANGNEFIAARVDGKEAVRAKSEWWIDNHEVHEMTAKGPYVGNDQNAFIVHYDYDVTMKASGERMQMSEVGIYQVHGDQIVEERFCPNLQ